MHYMNRVGNLMILFKFCKLKYFSTTNVTLIDFKYWLRIETLWCFILNHPPPQCGISSDQCY